MVGDNQTIACDTHALVDFTGIWLFIVKTNMWKLFQGTLIRNELKKANYPLQNISFLSESNEGKGSSL